MVCKRTFLIAVILPLLCLPLMAAGQLEGKFMDASQDPSLPFTITRYGTMQGLPQNQVTDIISKKNGSLIIATANGIVEYNGNAFVPFINAPYHNRKLHVRLFWDEAGGRLFGSELDNTFNAIHPDFRMVYRFCAASLSDRTIYGIDNDGTLLKRDIQGKKFTMIVRTGIRHSIWMHSEKGHHYIANPNGLYHVDEKTGRSNLLVADPAWHIQRNPYSGKLYAVSYSGSQLYEIVSPYKVRKIDLQTGLKKERLRLTDLAFVDADHWFVGSNRGLISVAPEGISVYGSNYFPAPDLMSLYYDKQQECLFIGTAMDGLLKLQMKSCRSYFDVPGIGESSIGSIVTDRSGTMYIAGSEGVVYIRTPLGIRQYARCKYALASLAIIDEHLYAGTWGGGVEIFRNGQLIDSIRRSQVNGGQSVHGIFRDSRRRIWLALGHGIAMGRSSLEVGQILPQIDESIITICELRNGTICLGGMQHVIFISPDGKKILKMLGEKEGLKAKETRSFYEDSEGKLWIGTYDGGLYCYEKGKLTSIHAMAGCKLQRDVFTLARDNGHLLMTSNKGLWAVSERKLNDFYRRRIPYLIPFYYGEASGIRHTEFNGGMLHNYLESPKGTFWFPTIQGLVVKSPGHVRYRKLLPEWLSLSVNDTVHPVGNRRFSRATHTVRFDFFCPTYSEKLNVHYQYKLTGPGLPDTWSRLEKKGYAEFKMLPPGKYRFSVRAIDGFNDSAPAEKAYTFEILPYYYETGWFRALVVIFVVLGIVTIVSLGYRRRLKKQDRENKINNTILELKLRAIQSKMDPHFIFNALNNIIYLLNAEKYAEAEELVHNFSLLLRRFLEKSDSTFLSVREELGIIDLYLLIEQKRYNQQFTYSIEIEECILESRIPTLLIQPLVENAIKHGISHTDRSCFIRIKAKKTATGIGITIEDNGIGQERAALINKTRKNHISKGIGLVREKIGIMQEKYGIAIHLEVIDLTEGKTTGTMCRLNIDFHD